MLYIYIYIRIQTPIINIGMCCTQVRPWPGDGREPVT